VTVLFRIATQSELGRKTCLLKRNLALDGAVHLPMPPEKGVLPSLKKTGRHVSRQAESETGPQE
jgi:hypothetical protein